MNRLNTFAFAASMALALTLPRPVRADVISDFGVFGAQGATLNGTTVVGGLTGSNANVSAGAFTSLTGVVGGGQLTFNGSAITQQVTFNGGVSIGNFVTGAAPINSLGSVTNNSVSGPITAGGNVTTGAMVSGNVLAGGNFASGPFSQVVGGVGANGSVNVGGVNLFFGGPAVTGNVTYGTTFAINPSSTVGGTTTQGTVSVNPTRFTPLTVPAADSFAAGGANVTVNTFQSLTLPPGSYGSLSLAGSSTLTLTAGNYYFTSVSTVGPFAFANVNFDLTNGPINVFVTGGINLTNSLMQEVLINGVPQTDPTLGRQIFFESLTNIALGGFAFDTMFGTYFAPNGNASTATFTNLNGALIAGGTVTTGNGTINAQPSGRFAVAPQAVPGPSGLCVAAACSLGLLVGRGRSARRTRPVR